MPGAGQAGDVPVRVLDLDVVVVHTDGRDDLPEGRVPLAMGHPPGPVLDPCVGVPSVPQAVEFGLQRAALLCGLVVLAIELGQDQPVPGVV